MFIKILFNYQGERTQAQGECVVRANGPEILSRGVAYSTGTCIMQWYSLYL